MCSELHWEKFECVGCCSYWTAHCTLPPSWTLFQTFLSVTLLGRSCQCMHPLIKRGRFLLNCPMTALIVFFISDNFLSDVVSLWPGQVDLLTLKTTLEIQGIISYLLFPNKPQCLVCSLLPTYNDTMKMIRPAGDFTISQSTVCTETPIYCRVILIIHSPLLSIKAKFILDAFL